MHISWLGNTAVKIQVKPFDKDVVVVIDPYRQDKGNFPRSLAPNIGLYTRGEKNSITLSGNPFTLDAPGECEHDGVLISSVQGHENGTTMIRIDAEQLSVGHVGLIKKQLDDKQLEVLSGVDVLLVPVGHPDGMDNEMAIKVINSIEPRIIIPIAYQSDNDIHAKPIEPFLREMGVKENKPEPKVIIKKKDLPQEETQVIVLSKE